MIGATNTGLFVWNEEILIHIAMPLQISQKYIANAWNQKKEACIQANTLLVEKIDISVSNMDSDLQAFCEKMFVVNSIEESDVRQVAKLYFKTILRGTAPSDFREPDFMKTVNSVCLGSEEYEFGYFKFEKDKLCSYCTNGEILFIAIPRDGQLPVHVFNYSNEKVFIEEYGKYRIEDFDTIEVKKVDLPQKDLKKYWNMFSSVQMDAKIEQMKADFEKAVEKAVARKQVVETMKKI